MDQILKPSTNCKEGSISKKKKGKNGFDMIQYSFQKEKVLHLRNEYKEN